MATLKEIFELYRTIKEQAKLFGALPGFLEENHRRYRAIGQAFLQDKSISLREAVSLPLDTPLTENAEARFEEWQQFLKENGVSL